jgi:hypothetical protein
VINEPPTGHAVLFKGRLDTQDVMVWLTDGQNGICLMSHDMGPMLERFFGEDEIETFLLIANDTRPALASALGVETEAVFAELARRYDGDSAATTNLRSFLDENDIPYEFHLT